MQNKVPASKQSPVKTSNTNPTQNKSNFPQNTGKFVDSRTELGPENGQQ
jgi:hypothetical protein